MQVEKTALIERNEVVEMVKELHDKGWKYWRIAEAVRDKGYKISTTTVGRIIKGKSTLKYKQRSKERPMKETKFDRLIDYNKRLVTLKNNIKLGDIVEIRDTTEETRIRYETGQKKDVIMKLKVIGKYQNFIKAENGECYQYTEILKHIRGQLK